MRLGRFHTVVLVLGLVSGAWASEYQGALEQWRRQREARLKAEDGWLTVAGLFWLKEGANRCGADPLSDIVLPAGSAPLRVGTFEFRASRTVFEAQPGVKVISAGQVVTRLELQADVPGPPTLLAVGDLTFQVIRRGSRFAVRLKDKNSKLRREFAGLGWFPADPAYRLQARFVRYLTPRTLAVPNILGYTEELPSPGHAVFTLEGREQRLHPVVEDGRLFFVFRDQTAGKQTYPGGRFLYADMPKGDQVVLDFNKAINPPCAFNPYTTCPLPPRQNHLLVPIRAGELYTPAKP